MDFVNLLDKVNLNNILMVQKLLKVVRLFAKMLLKNERIMSTKYINGEILYMHMKNTVKDDSNFLVRHFYLLLDGCQSVSGVESILDVATALNPNGISTSLRCSR